MALADDVTRKLEAGRGRIVAALRDLANQIERAPLEDASETMARVWFEVEVT